MIFGRRVKTVRLWKSSLLRHYFITYVNFFTGKIFGANYFRICMQDQHIYHVIFMYYDITRCVGTSGSHLY